MVKQLWLANSGNQEAPLSQDLLDTRATFSVLSVLRPVGPQSQVKLLLEFAPQECAEFQEVLRLQSPRMALRVQLKGQGIAPAIKVCPPPPPSPASQLQHGALQSMPVAHKVQHYLCRIDIYDMFHGCQISH